MMVDLTKLLLLLIGYALYGPPDDYDHAWSVRAGFALPGPSVSLEVSYDPVAIYYRSLDRVAGRAWGQFVLVDPDYNPKGTTLEHELNHIWQFRTYGLIVPLTYGLEPTLSPWEPKPYTYNNLSMPAPRQLNFPLFRLVLGLEIGK